MTNEPLTEEKKRKLYFGAPISTELFVYCEKDVLSAVELLREKICDCEINWLQDISAVCTYCEIIEECFPVARKK